MLPEWYFELVFTKENLSCFWWDLDIWILIEIQAHKYSSKTGLKHLKRVDFLHGSENVVLWFVHVNMTSRSCLAGKVFRDVIQAFLIEMDSTHGNTAPRILRSLYSMM